MGLFQIESQYREKAAAWRIFSLLPLYAALAAGRVWRWFTINIPMDLGTGGSFTSDIDIIARLSDFPHSNKWIYRTWEVKVSLLCKDGSARSLKAGKLKRTITQLQVYRRFGAPNVSLLDVYTCEAGFMRANRFPPQSLERTLGTRVTALRETGFGYQLLPFEHADDKGTDVGLSAIRSEKNPLETTFNILSADASKPEQPFSRLAEHIDEFFESASERPKKHFHQVVFCRACRRLQLVKVKEDDTCPSCGDYLIAQF
jgi:hypothetical protein